MPPKKKLSCQIIDLESVYPNLFLKDFYDDYWDGNMDITALTGHFSYIDRAPSSAFSISMCLRQLPYGQVHY